MATASRYCPSCLSTLRVRPIQLPYRASPILSHQQPTTTFTQHRNAVTTSRQKQAQAQAAKKKKKAKANLPAPSLKPITKYTLVDAMRYLRAAEVGRGAASSKYELAVRLRTPRDTFLVRGRISLPHPVSTGGRIAVIVDPESSQARAAIDAGAAIVGEDNIINAVKEGRIEFDKCLCHVGSYAKLQKSGVARTLGPRGLMPNTKMNTVVENVAQAVKFSGGASTYKETTGVIRMAIGQLGFTPDELSKNITAFTTRLRRDIADLSSTVTKDIHEVVLSSTNGPGFSLSGQVRAEGGLDPRDVSVVN